MTEAPRPSPRPRPALEVGAPAAPPSGPPLAPPGYYPDPQGRPEMRWWDGQQWTSTAFVVPGSSKAQLRIMGAVLAGVLGLIGIFMNLQPVSVLSGTSTVWTGAALVVAGAIIGFIPALSHWSVGAVLTVVALFAIANAGYEQHQVDQRIDQLNNASAR